MALTPRRAATRSPLLRALLLLLAQADTLREALSIAAQEQVLQGDLLAEMGVGDEELPTADDLARLDASTASRFVVAPDGSYLKQQVQVPVEVGTRHTGAGAGPR